MTMRCRICGKERSSEAVGECRTALRHMEAATRGARCPSCGRGHLDCVRFVA